MNIEKKLVKLLINKTKVITEYLSIDEDGTDEDMVELEITIGNNKIRCSCDNHFDALKELRCHLEKDNIQILCNGAAKNVYPSPMQFSMGNTRKAYKTYLGTQARKEDMVDIFDSEEDLEFVSICEQARFNEIWANS